MESFVEKNIRQASVSAVLLLNLLRSMKVSPSLDFDSYLSYRKRIGAIMRVDMRAKRYRSLSDLRRLLITLGFQLEVITGTAIDSFHCRLGTPGVD